MRTTSVTAVALAMLGVAACAGKDKQVNDDLAKDIALASSSEGIALAPSMGSGRGVVSAVEQIRPATKRVAPSQKSVVHHKAPTHHTQAPVQVADAQAPTVAAAPAPEPPQVETPEPDPAGTDESDGAMQAPRPHPAPVDPDPGPAGPSIGDIIGAVIRGAVVDGDHCDPRADRRGGVFISINNRIPGRPVGHGTF
jgi:hypothetical protein